MSTDNRPAVVVMKQFKELQYLKQQLVKTGQVSTDANAAQVIEALRAACPAHLFTEKPSAK